MTDGHDTGYAPERWVFDDEVTRVFDDMLERSIPQYRVMRRAVYDLACHYHKEHHDIVDLGCSRGEALAPLVDKYGAHNRFIGIDISEPMLEAARERFKLYMPTGIVSIRNMDLRQEYPPAQACVTMAVLTMVFVPINYRQRIIADAYNSTVSGGAFILVEKVLGESAKIDGLMVERYHQMKRDNGYSADEVERKRLALEGVQVPITARWNEDLLRTAGFKYVDCFWRWMNFAGWIAVK